MKAAVAAGMSSSAALAMTPEDVKAADSDQVTIAFDTEGEVKKQIAADTLEWYYRARDATEQITQGHFHKDGVHRVATRGGGPKDNAHVHVILDDENGHADERRGEIPEEKNGVRVDVDTYDQTESNDHCDPECWPSDQNFPGGQGIEAVINNGEGTISSQLYEAGLGWFGWTTAAHVLQDYCYYRSEIQHDTGGCLYTIGHTSDVDPERDIAFIEADVDVYPSHWNRHPEHTEGVQVNGTVTEEGIVTIDEANQCHFIYGRTSCKTSMCLEEWNGTHEKGGSCSSKLIDQMYSGGSFFGGTDEGDSGALYTVEDPNYPGNFYALGSHSGKEFFGTSRTDNYGCQGFSIRQTYDRRWDN
jgi:hypothetical protein